MAEEKENELKEEELKEEEADKVVGGGSTKCDANLKGTVLAKIPRLPN